MIKHYPHIVVLAFYFMVPKMSWHWNVNIGHIPCQGRYSLRCHNNQHNDIPHKNVQPNNDKPVNEGCGSSILVCLKVPKRSDIKN
jgi:hypothetical protein